MILVPAVAVTPPVHVPPTVDGDATTRPDGIVSTSAADNVSAYGFSFPSVNVSVDVPFTTISVGKNAFPTVGSLYTHRSAVTGPAFVPTSVTSAPAAIVFVYFPSVPDRTGTVIVHPPAGMVAPEAYVIVPVPPAAVTVPVHVPPIVGDGPTTRFVGSVSVKSDDRVIE